MPKLIIPNALEIYQTEKITISPEEAIIRQNYSLRFLWCLQPGDIILLPTPPAKAFVNYLAHMKRIDPDSLNIVVLDKPDVPISAALNTPTVIKHLKKWINPSASWSIQTCFFNSSVLRLADNLNIPLASKWRKLISEDFCRQANSKARFRQLATTHALPITEGQVCVSSKALAQAMINFLKKTGQIIIKQDLQAGGRGNIGVASNAKAKFCGVAEIITLPSQDHECVKQVANNLWNNYTHTTNQPFIVEVYYPNTGTFTAQVWIPPENKAPVLLNYCEIRMESLWIGVKISAQTLASEHKQTLISNSMKIATILQANGYQGFVCCDAILTKENGLLFTEINVRPGAELNAHHLAQHFFGPNYMQQVSILTRRNLKLSSFLSMHQKLKEKGLLLNPGQKEGLAFLTIEDQSAMQAEYLATAPTLERAYQLENEWLSLM